ncbi:hypothetical protein J6590_001876 [Homalodisca vitripennis]|nr:hypothetical protein J6590_001876 [Homalodisca vitripennis]
MTTFTVTKTPITLTSEFDQYEESGQADKWVKACRRSDEERNWRGSGRLEARSERELGSQATGYHYGRIASNRAARLPAHGAAPRLCPNDRHCDGFLSRFGKVSLLDMLPTEH